MLGFLRQPNLHTFIGVGIDHNITSAAIKAIFNGLNRHLEANVPAVEEQAIFAATT
ncbi:MAG: hypothetical protein WC997_00430 [Porticoccaceae bacterium]